MFSLNMTSKPFFNENFSTQLTFEFFILTIFTFIFQLSIKIIFIQIFPTFNADKGHLLSITSKILGILGSRASSNSRL